MTPTPPDTTLRQQLEAIAADIDGCPGGEHLESHIDDLEALCQGIAREARLEGAEALAARIHEHKPMFHTPGKCKLYAVVDGHLSILKSELTQKPEGAN